MYVLTSCFPHTTYLSAAPAEIIWVKCNKEMSPGLCELYLPQSQERGAVVSQAKYRSNMCSSTGALNTIPIQERMAA